MLTLYMQKASHRCIEEAYVVSSPAKEIDLVTEPSTDHESMILRDVSMQILYYKAPHSL